MADEEQWTCGKGLAQHSALPRHMAAVATAMSDMLDHHRTSLDLADPDSRPELDAYTALANEYRDIAAALNATADRMAGYRDLPMAPHDTAVLSGADAIAKLESVVRAERELAQLLREYGGRYEGMLASMRGSDDSSVS